MSSIALTPAARERAALSETRPGRRVAASQQLGQLRLQRARAPFDHRQPGSRAAERTGYADQVAGPRSVAPDQLAGVVDPADDRERDDQCRRRGDVAAGDRHAELPRERRGAGDHRPRLFQIRSAGQAERQVRLRPAGNAHRGQVGQRRGERAAADLLRSQLRAAEVNAVHHRVHRGDGIAAPADDRGVVAEAAHETRVICGKQRAQLGDQLELLHGVAPSLGAGWLPVAVDDPRAIEVVR